MALEALSSSTTISSSSSFSSSIFSLRVTDSPKFVRVHTCSKKNNGDSDVQSGSNSTSIVPLFSSRSNGTGARCGVGERMDDRVGYGRPAVAAGKGDESGTERISTFPWSLFTKSPRRRMRVAFTCNICGQRTSRAINPHAYRDGAVFVQCCGCNVFHKLVDNLNLFHEVKCYVIHSFNYRDTSWNVGSKHELDDDDADVFPV